MIIDDDDNNNDGEDDDNGDEHVADVVDGDDADNVMAMIIPTMTDEVNIDSVIIQTHHLRVSFLMVGTAMSVNNLIIVSRLQS